MSKLRTKLAFKSIGISGISMELTFGKGTPVLNFILSVLAFIPMDLKEAQTEINKLIDKELEDRG